MLYKVEGIVIRAMDYGEGNKIVTLFTRETGKVGIIARGAKKIKSRFGAMTQLFTYGQFLFYKSGQMGTLQSGEIWDAHHRLREDLHMAAYSSYLMELTDRMLGDLERYELIFEQLQAALQAIQEEKDSQIIVHIYEMKMLYIAGYFPQLAHCINCGENQAELRFSIELGGVLCSRCIERDRSAIVLSSGALKLLRICQQADIRRLGTIDVKDSTKAQLKLCMRGFMDKYVDITWKSRKFLDQMDKYNM